MVKYTSEIRAFTGIAVMLAVVVGLHLVVVVVRRLSRKVMTMKTGAKLSKSKTIVSLATSVIVFSLYFTAIGLILRALGISLKAYLASASILGLAIGFGSQGLCRTL